MSDKVYKIDDGGVNIMWHYFVFMLGALKDIDLSSKINLCFDNENYFSHQRESFEILSDIINVVPNTDNYQSLPFVKPFNCSNGDGRPLVDYSVYAFVRELFLSRVGNDFDTTEYSKIYIRRSRSHLSDLNKNDGVFPNARRRQIVNEDELVESLKKIGIKSVFFEDYTISQKIQIARDASLIVAPQSGALTFLLFASMSTSVVEIYPPNPHQYCDQHIDVSRALNIPFRRFSDVQKVDQWDNMLVNPSNLNNFILEK